MNNLPPAKAVIRKSKWPFALVWIVPLFALVLAGLYLHDYLLNIGPTVVIKFSDASGLTAGQTRVLYRGSQVGRVVSISLSEDHRHSLVTVQLQKREDIFATKGAVYWIVQPEFSQLSLTGLDTILSGAYIHASPGEGREKTSELEGLLQEPLPYEEGRHFLLTTSHLGHLEVGSSVLYKGLRVGSVRKIELSKDASTVDIDIIVLKHDSHLVRENSIFWVNSSIALSGGLFSGFHVSVDPLKVLAAGAISFATPEQSIKNQAKEGTAFELQENPKDEWNHWSPRIQNGPETTGTISSNR